MIFGYSLPFPKVKAATMRPSSSTFLDDEAAVILKGMLVNDLMPLEALEELAINISEDDSSMITLPVNIRTVPALLFRYASLNPQNFLAVCSFLVAGTEPYHFQNAADLSNPMRELLFPKSSQEVEGNRGIFTLAFCS